MTRKILFTCVMFGWHDWDWTRYHADSSKWFTSKTGAAPATLTCNRCGQAMGLFDKMR